MSTVAPVRPVAGRRQPRHPSLRPPSLRNTPAPETANSNSSTNYNNNSGPKCKACISSEVKEVNGQLVCMGCAVIVSDSIIVNDVTFGEAPNGAALVQGTTVHAGQRMAKSSGTAFRRGGRAPDEVQDANLRAAREEMTRLAGTLMITKFVDRALHIYQLARMHIRKPLLESVAVCLYIVCRERNEPVLLIDIAEKIKQNVYELGATYKRFVRDVSMEENVKKTQSLEIEAIIHRLAARMEFAGDTKKVATDAVKIVSRWNRDWIVTGRQPAGYIGAALVLAARMNNYARTVREVVFTVKAGEATVLKRLAEFRKTKAGNMTVKSFREVGHRLKVGGALPPAVYQAAEKSKRRQRKENVRRSRSPGASSSASQTPQPEDRPSPERRVDNEGFAIPEVPNSRTKRPRAVDSPATTDIQSNQNEEDESARPSKRQRTAPTPSTRATRSSSKTAAPSSSAPTSSNPAASSSSATTPSSTAHTDSTPTETTAIRAPRVSALSRKRKALSQLPTPDPSQGSGRSTPSTASSKPPAKRGRPRKNQSQQSGSTSGSPIDLTSVLDGPIDLTALAESALADDEDFLPRKRRATKKFVPAKIFVPTEEDLLAEDELAAEINRIVEHEVSLDDEGYYEITRVRSRAIAAIERAKVVAKSKNGTHDSHLDDEEIADDEFDDDPVVKYALFTPEERGAKEVVWITNNHDWMRKQQEIMLNRQMDAACEKKRKPRTTKKAAEHSPASTAAEAVQRVIGAKKGGRTPFSRHLDYSKLHVIYGIGPVQPEVVAAEGDAPGAEVEEEEEEEELIEVEEEGDAGVAPGGSFLPQGDSEEEEEEELVEEDWDSEADGPRPVYVSDEEEEEELDYDAIALNPEYFSDGY
ncbi:hypothetical protein BT63DRAFT_428253 [Microthyrium microscopicum]|uniref:B-related factor 1 n=1 Tax=Microthyrium microscopicum TaxID=703497 RepID=A0A6A6U000_9PEZI|nr:hypothetical protein BT63DRAFT_428253 [Microthyrium microscopicum]